MRPDFVEAMLNVAGVAINVQDFGKALELYQRVVELQPDNIEAKLSLAVAMRGMKDSEGAEKIYNEIIAKNPTSPAAYFNLAVLYQEYLKDFDKAKATFEKFVAIPTASEVAPAEFETAKLRIGELENVIAERAKAKAEDIAKCGVSPCPEPPHPRRRRHNPPPPPTAPLPPPTAQPPPPADGTTSPQ